MVELSHTRCPADHAATMIAPSMPLIPGSTLGQGAILAEIGHGGMGVVG